VKSASVGVSGRQDQPKEPSAPSRQARVDPRRPGKARLSATSAARAELSVAHLLPDAIGLLVQEPLKQFQASLACGDDAVLAGGLCPLVSFVERLLVSIQEVRHHCSSVPAGQDAGSVMQWLSEKREELVLWGQCAGKALRGLASTSGLRAVGSRLEGLQASLAQAIEANRGGLRSGIDDEFATLRSEMRSAQEEARASRDEVATERREFHSALQGMAPRSFAEEQRSSGQGLVRSVMEELAQERSEVRRLADLTGDFQRFSESWSTEAAMREKEVRALQEQAKLAITEMRQSEGHAEVARNHAMAQQQQMDALRNKTAHELHEHRVAHNEALARVRENAARDLACERQERGALALQLTEAMDTISVRDRSIGDLRQSLTEELERIRHPPVQSSMQTDAPLMGSGAGRMPPLPRPETWGKAPPSHGIRPGEAEPSFPPPPLFPSAASHMASPAPPSRYDAFACRDGSSSVCRISTDSTAFGGGFSGVALGGYPVWQAHSGEANNGADRGTPSMQTTPVQRRHVIEVASAMRPVPTEPVQRSVLEAGAPQAKPWDLPPGEFLELWRRSRGSVLAGVDAPSGVDAQSRTLEMGFDALRITASLE